jgi:uncharacterized protein YjbI with pentapeptide repeats
MANQEQVELLKQGFAVWNMWRLRHPKATLDLRSADLCFADLRDTDLCGANLSLTHLRDADLRRADLYGANLSDAELSFARLHDADLCGVDLRRANLIRADLYGANLSGANLRGANLNGTNLFRANLNGANLSGANFNNTNLSHANLSGIDLHDVNLSRTNLVGADLGGADLSGTDLSKVNLGGADLSGTNLVGADLSSVNLSEANLSGANLSRTNLIGANLSRTNLIGANLSRTNLIGANLNGANFHKTRLSYAILAAIDLCTINGLDTIIHGGPSYVDVKTVRLPEGETRTHFLQGVGFSDTFIDYYHSLFTAVIQYASCFISYAHQDEVLAQRLYKDLQDKGVRCWFAPHDLRPGTLFYRGIEDAIQIHETVILLLSEHAVKSNWVAHEVETTLNRQARERREILFPIRLDDAIFQNTDAWAMTLRDSRHIGDFTNWHDDAIYQQHFAELLRHLKVKTI